MNDVDRPRSAAMVLASQATSIVALGVLAVAYVGVPFMGGGGSPSGSTKISDPAPEAPTPAFVLDFEDFADNAAFKSASQLQHRCSPDFPVCTGDANVDTELVSATTALGSTKAGRCYYAHRDSAAVYGESDILCTIKWNISGGTNSAVNLIHGEFRHSNTAVGDLTSWNHTSGGLHKTQFVNGSGFARVAEMKFGATLMEAKYNNNQFGDTAIVANPNYVWNGQWYEYCQLVIVNTASGIYNLKVDTALVATLTGLNFASSADIISLELGVNSLPDPSPVNGQNAFMEWGRHEIYTDTVGVAAAYSVCDFSGDG